VAFSDAVIAGCTVSLVSDPTPLLPPPVIELLDVALVGELTVVDESGLPITYPLIPLSDGNLIYMTSSVLFSRKLRHIKTNPKVCLSLTDPVAIPVDPFHRATIQGDARVVEDDVHEGWENLLPMWRAKEPAIDFFLKKRFGIPLFFERSVIEITPRRVLWWEDGRASEPARVYELAGVS
jgi:general stress protein 26